MNKSESQNEETASGGIDIASDGTNIALDGIDIASGGTDTASGGYDIASGGADIASGGGDIASGGTDTASGGYDIAWGGADIASGGYDIAWGGADIASGGYDIASGGGDIASGGYDIASGSGDIASGGTDTASGGSDIALGNYIRERKRRSRKIFLNWGKFDQSETLDNEHAAGMKNDFADLLNVPTDCNFFQFKSEKDWDKEATHSTFSCQRFFNLNLDVLSQGLECLPYYEKILMEKSLLPGSDIETCDRKASEALEKYKEMRENFEKELAENEKLSKSFEDLTGIKWEPRKPKVVEPKEIDEPVEEEMDPQSSHGGRFWISHRTELKEKGDDSYLAPSSSSDESLELWLDTVLDD